MSKITNDGLNRSVLNTNMATLGVIGLKEAKNYTGPRGLKLDKAGPD